MIDLNWFFTLLNFRTKSKLHSISFLSISFIILTSCEKYPCPPDPTREENVVSTLILQKSSGASRSTMLEAFANTTNYGNSELILSGEYGSGGLQERILLDFDFSSIPSNAKIKKATLTLYANTTSPAHLFYSNQGHFSDPSPATNESFLCRVTSNWDQSTVTWDTSPSFDGVNQITVPASTSFDQNYTVDVTTLVADQVKNPNTFYGFLMISNNGDLFAPAYLSFCSSTYSDAQLRPKLEIKYQLP